MTGNYFMMGISGNKKRVPPIYNGNYLLKAVLSARQHLGKQHISVIESKKEIVIKMKEKSP